MKAFKLEVNQTVNILHNGIQRSAMVYSVSRCQIDVRFWGDSLDFEIFRSFTTFGVVKYLKDENSKILSISL